ncbi:S26 family signal peptidase [Nisaea sp.]|uniref:S26 family signal peptidase n=1 Tax=Nisaea sp. TaxID=2024842 RepID=UPI003262E073
MRLKKTPLVAVLAGVILLPLSFVTKPTKPLLHVPSTGSVSFDIYYESSQIPSVGSYVLARVPDDAAELATRREYSPADTDWIKRVAATEGDFVCIERKIVTVNHTVVARIHALDSSGRALPQIRFCRPLEDDEFFLLGDADQSFDSRYFGPVRRHNVVTTLRPILKAIGL